MGQSLLRLGKSASENPPAGSSSRNRAGLGSAHPLPPVIWGKGREQLPPPPPPLSGEGGGSSEGGEFWRDSAHLTGCDRGETRGTFGPRIAGEASVSAHSHPLPSYHTYTPCGSCGSFRRQGHAFSGTDTPLLPPRPLFFSVKPIGRTGPRKGVGRRQARRGCSVVRATGMCICRSALGGRGGGRGDGLFQRSRSSRWTGQALATAGLSFVWHRPYFGSAQPPSCLGQIDQV